MGMFDEERNERSSRLLELLKDFSDTDYSWRDDKENVIDRIEYIYSTKNGYTYKHQYSEISRFLYNRKISVEACELICDTLDEISCDVQNEQVIQGIEKLIDHISLESLRIGQIEQVLVQNERMEAMQAKAETLISSAEVSVSELEEKKSEFTEIGKDLDEERENVKEMLVKVRSHNIQTITTLSIFACIVFAFTGGFSIAANSLTAIMNIQRCNAPFFLACMLLLMLVLYDVIHMLLYFTHRLTLGDAKGKHYLFWVINAIGLLGAIGLLIWYFTGSF